MSSLGRKESIIPGHLIRAGMGQCRYLGGSSAWLELADDNCHGPCATRAPRRQTHRETARLASRSFTRFSRFDCKVVWGEDLMELTFAEPVIANIEGY